jgi:hypothetical protein
MTLFSTIYYLLLPFATSYLLSATCTLLPVI